MIERFLLPDLGEGLPEAEIVQWLVEEGDAVALNQTIAEVETAKAIVEIPSPHAGVVRTLHAAAGDVVDVGAPLISFDVDVDVEERVEAPIAAPAAASDDEESGPNLVGYGAAARRSGPPRRRPRTRAGRTRAVDTAVLEAAPHDARPRPVPADEPGRERPRSTPPVRALAKQLGVDLALVEASGVAGVITRGDVEAYATATAPARTAEAQPSAPSPADGGVDARTTRIPIRGVRKHTAEAMVRSAFTAPHVTTFLTVDVTETMDLLTRLREEREYREERIGILAVVAKAVCLALQRHPELNARWDQDAGEIVQHHYVNLGIAAATPRGLLVPHIADADRMSAVALSRAIRDLADTARAGRTAPGVLAGGTFSITNVGVFGIDAGTPILNPGEAGILALGAVQPRPWEHRGAVALRQVTTLALSFDHRLVDGEQGARFLAFVGELLRDPARALLLG